MIRYKCTVAYEGSGFCGWQTQKKGDSIQEAIEEAIRHLTTEEIHILASGRTDAGVNALGQVFQFDSRLDLTERKMMGALNAFLPDGIHIMKVEKKDRRFHVRYCVRLKQYDYTINTGPYDVFSRHHAYQCPYPLDIAKMKEAAQVLVGTHDFTSFNSNTLRETPDQVRTIYAIEFHENGPFLTISYIGRGFLRYMVRMMTAQLLEAGQGKITPDDVRKKLEARSKTVSRKNAHPEGLTLVKVDYFEIIALSPNCTVREFLAEDELPEGLRLEELEADVREKKLPRIYGLFERHSGENFGICVIGPHGSVISGLEHAEKEEAQKILEDLREYQSSEGIPARIAVMETDSAPNPDENRPREGGKAKSGAKTRKTSKKSAK
ncbi:MAG: tRNA pseudouridine(38-40) synthase TruA [Solobacterium sp.]|nr:tRNA pseudouridine(38-40) synthase TruA [Solobacterium sp.]